MPLIRQCFHVSWVRRMSVAIAVLNLLACSTAATEVVPAGRFQMVRFRGELLPTTVASESPDEIVGGSLLLDAGRYELSMQSRSRADSTRPLESWVSRGRVRFVSGEFRLIHEQGDGGPLGGGFFPMLITGEASVRVLSQLGSAIDFVRE